MINLFTTSAWRWLQAASDSVLLSRLSKLITDDPLPPRGAIAVITRSATCLNIFVMLSACSADTAPPLPPQAIELPTGAALATSGRWLFVVNSNLDAVHSGSTLITLDLKLLDDALISEASKIETSEKYPCRLSPSGDTPEPKIIECDPKWLIDPTHTVELPSGGGNIGVDYPSGTGSQMRLLIPSGIESAVTRVDVSFPDHDMVKVDCGQETWRCSEQHIVSRSIQGDQRFAPDPSRLYISPNNRFRLGYIPHLLGGRLTLLALDGGNGPALVDTSNDFYKENGAQFAGGFAVAERPCMADAAPRSTLNCTLPLLYTTHRYRREVRVFTVSPGEPEINDDPEQYPPRNGTIRGFLPNDSDSRPILGDLGFADPLGNLLLVVQTIPPSLAAIDTSIDPVTEEPRFSLIRTIPVCSNPNLLRILTPAEGSPLAFISCFSDDRIAVIEVNSLEVVQFIDVDDGPNELVVDHTRMKLYSIHTLANTIGAIELDRTSPDYLRLVYRIGLLN